MKFVIESTTLSVDELSKKYPFLSEFEFSIDEEIRPTRYPIRDETGKRIYQLGSRTVRVPHVNIETVEQLINLARKCRRENGLIVTPHYEIYDSIKKKWVATDRPRIEIYDGYRE